MSVLLCLIPPLLALLLLMRRWQHPWQLSLPLFLLRRAAVDPALLVEPRRMACAHLPFQPTAQPRLQSGALLWASAATVTHTLAHEDDRAAILAAVKPLGFTPDQFLVRCPVLQEVEHCGLRGRIVRDGHGQRAYFLGQPDAVLNGCDRVLDQPERDKTDGDLHRLPTGEGLYGFAMAPVTEGHIGPMTYLGSMQIITPTMTPEAAQALLPEGWTLCDGPVDALTLHIAPQPAGPNRLLADTSGWHSLLADGHRRACSQRRILLCLLIIQLALGIAALLWRIPPWVAPLGGLLLLPGALQARELRFTRRGPLALAWLLLWPVLMGLFMGYAAPGSTAPALTLTVCAAWLGFSRATWKPVLSLTLVCAALLWLLLRPALLPAAFCLVAGALHGLVVRWIRPVECS